MKPYFSGAEPTFFSQLRMKIPEDNLVLFLRFGHVVYDTMVMLTGLPIRLCTTPLVSNSTNSLR